LFSLLLISTYSDVLRNSLFRQFSAIHMDIDNDSIAPNQSISQIDDELPSSTNPPLRTSGSFLNSSSQKTSIGEYIVILNTPESLEMASQLTAKSPNTVYA